MESSTAIHAIESVFELTYVDKKYASNNDGFRQCITHLSTLWKFNYDIFVITVNVS